MLYTIYNYHTMTLVRFMEYCFFYLPQTAIWVSDPCFVYLTTTLFAVHNLFYLYLYFDMTSHDNRSYRCYQRGDLHPPSISGRAVSEVTTDWPVWKTSVDLHWPLVFQRRPVRRVSSPVSPSTRPTSVSTRQAPTWRRVIMSAILTDRILSFSHLTSIVFLHN